MRHSFVNRFTQQLKQSRLRRSTRWIWLCTLVLGCTGWPLTYGYQRPGGQGWKPLLNGRDVSGWHAQDGKPVSWFTTAPLSTRSPEETGLNVSPVPGGVIVNTSDTKNSNLVTDEEFGDLELHVEFLLPKRSNSGIYVHGLYEVQIADSYGVKELTSHHCGGIYQRWADGKGVGGTAPSSNAAHPAGQWQSFDIRFQAPRFDSAGRKVANARFLEVRHNGIVVQKDVAVDGPTRASMNLREAPENPIMIQGDHGPIALRNLYVRPLRARGPKSARAQ